MLCFWDYENVKKNHLSKHRGSQQTPSRLDLNRKASGKNELRSRTENTNWHVSLHKINSSHFSVIPHFLKMILLTVKLCTFIEGIRNASPCTVVLFAPGVLAVTCSHLWFCFPALWTNALFKMNASQFCKSKVHCYMRMMHGQNQNVATT